MKKISTMNALGCLTSLFLISACTQPKVEPVQTVIVKRVEVQKPEPIVPSVDQLKLRPVTWIVITPENAEAQFKKIGNKDVVLFALTTEGYKNLALNTSDIRANIEQYKKIIVVYKAQY